MGSPAGGVETAIGRKVEPGGKTRGRRAASVPTARFSAKPRGARPGFFSGGTIAGVA